MGGDGFYSVADPSDHNVVYSESQNGVISRYDRRPAQLIAEIMTTGVKQAVALGLIGVTVGEMFGCSEGIGFMVAYGGQTLATDTLFAGVTIIAGAGIVLTWMAERLERRFSRWRPER